MKSTDLTPMLDAARHWYETSGREGAPVYLAYERHPGVDLSGAILAEGTMQEAELPGARLDRVNGIGALANGIDLHGASLVDADFSRADLVEADLRDVSAQGVRLRKARLTRARFGNADLRHAELEGANLTGADLRGADLRGANLVGAILADADLRGARLAGTHLTRAVLSGTTHLEGATGLDEVNAEWLTVDGIRMGGDVLPRLAAGHQ
jgi:uncharacterized protein YjbI with pentapeptide repeats